MTLQCTGTCVPGSMLMRNGPADSTQWTYTTLFAKITPMFTRRRSSRRGAPCAGAGRSSSCPCGWRSRRAPRGAGRRRSGGERIARDQGEPLELDGQTVHRRLGQLRGGAEIGQASLPKIPSPPPPGCGGPFRAGPNADLAPYSVQRNYRSSRRNFQDFSSQPRAGLSMRCATRGKGTWTRSFRTLISCSGREASTDFGHIRPPLLADVQAANAPRRPGARFSSTMRDVVSIDFLTIPTARLHTLFLLIVSTGEGVQLDRLPAYNCAFSSLETCPD